MELTCQSGGASTWHDQMGGEQTRHTEQPRGEGHRMRRKHRSWINPLGATARIGDAVALRGASRRPGAVLDEPLGADEASDVRGTVSTGGWARATAMFGLAQKEKGGGLRKRVVRPSGLAQSDASQGDGRPATWRLVRCSPTVGRQARMGTGDPRRSKRKQTRWRENQAREAVSLRVAG